MSADVKVAIIYYSATGSTYQLALAVEEGAKGTGAQTRLREVEELAPKEEIATNQGWAAHRKATQHIATATLTDLEWADAIIFGTPTRFGLLAAQLKQFIDRTGKLWSQGKLANKIVSSFSSSGTAHGGQETTITALNNVFYHWGSIIVPPGYLDPVQFQVGNPYGVSYTSDNGSVPPNEIVLEAARFQGRRVAEVAAYFVSGRAQIAH
ncbi:NAD(P)H:quinone oxidoreductase [Dictyobacter aurantiacus]|uniref:TrpR-binding protein WrbA n=1 Tax=Dictyobacter aurantiacus TaxID=1936993 RepID=A0A401ZLY9_9CHLR|nr:NAD(P)H:quinone oxidoreductase [Dictyobacter aurantiacus]GCE07848.1 TrpR-binding protein WrbA [Dictyobacter aurantiacus]